MATVRHRWEWRDKHNATCQKCGTHAQKRPSPYGRRWWTEWRLPDGTRRDRPLMASNRLSGHTLRAEGKPFTWTRSGGRYVRTEDVEGVGLCSCGAHSAKVTSDGARKRWHRAHKDEIRATEVPDGA